MSIDFNDPGTECERHGGPWGSDETCPRCTFEDGTVRPISEPGPLGPGAEESVRGCSCGMADYGAPGHDGEEAVCRHCSRRIIREDGGWIDPEATGDDSMWRETCDANHEDRIAAHEPEGPRADPQQVPSDITVVK